MEALIKLALAGVVLGFALWRVSKMRAALREPLSDNECAACGSQAVQATAPGCYVCSACGYEGGTGQQRAKEEAKIARMASMSSAERFEKGRSSLREAGMLLEAADGTFEAALSESRVDMIGSINASETKTNILSSAQGDVLRAQECIREASLYLEDPTIAQITGVSSDGKLDAVAGVEHHVDFIGADLLVHGRIKKARAEAQQLLGVVRRAEERLVEIGAYRQ